MLLAGTRHEVRRRKVRPRKKQTDLRDALLRALEKDEENQLDETTHFKALKHSGGRRGYQAMEKEQIPPSKFPSTLASYALVFTTDEEWENELNGGEPDPAQPSFAKLNKQPLVDKLRSADMIVREVPSEDMKYMFALVSISEKRQRQVAEIMSQPPHNLIRLRMMREDDEGQEIKQGGAWNPFKQHLAHLYEKSTEDTLFSSFTGRTEVSRQQCQIIEFLMNGEDEKALGPQLVQREACEPGLSPLQQLKKDDRIEGFFYLHHPRKKQWLLKYWAHSYLTKQPHDDIREYLGEEIGLMFVFVGYLLTSMWVPAVTGIFVVFMEITAAAENGGSTGDNPYMPLYAVFMAVWAILFRAGWGRLEMIYQLEWGIEDFQEEEADREPFLSNPRTYKRLNKLTQNEEYYPDPLWRIGALVLSFFGVLALIAASIFVHISIEAAKSGIAQLLGWGAEAVLPKVLACILQASSILLFRALADWLFTMLCDWENWQKDSEYSAAMISKKFCFGFVNSYFPIYFVGFMANYVKPFGVDVSCHEGRCLDYMTMMIAIIYIQNILTRYFLTYFGPSISRWWANRDEQAGAEEEEEEEKEEEDEGDGVDPAAAKVVNHERRLEEFEGVDDQFTEKFFHLGYVMLFGAAFPLLTLFSLLNNMFDVRQLAKHMMSGVQRPAYKCAKDIGHWMTILDIFVIMSIVSQCCFLAFTSNGLFYYFPYMNEVQKTFYAVLIEHLLLLFKVLVDGAYSELPKEVEEEYETRKNERDELLENFDHFNPEEDVIFYTDDEGNVDLGKPKEKKGNQ